jgi:hypothetical protein
VTTGVSAATVTWIGPVNGTGSADPAGRFATGGLPDGTYTITASLPAASPVSPLPWSPPVSPLPSTLTPPVRRDPKPEPPARPALISRGAGPGPMPRPLTRLRETGPAARHRPTWWTRCCRRAGAGLGGQVRPRHAARATR